MKFTIRKHVSSGIGEDLFLKKDVDLTMAPFVGLQLALGNTVEQVIEIVYNVDTDAISLWVKPDSEMAVDENTKWQKDVALDKLAKKMRDYQNSGWNLQ